MELDDRKYRFTEIVTAISLLPALDESDEIPTLPQRTMGLADGNLKSALASQAHREGEEFSNKLVNALVGSAMYNIKESDNPTPDDMSALGLAMSLAWANNQLPYFLAIGGMVSQVFAVHENEDNREFLIPNEIRAIVGKGNNSRSFGQFEPYDLLEDKVDVEDVLEGLNPTLADSLRDVLSDLLGKDK